MGYFDRWKLAKHTPGGQDHEQKNHAGLTNGGTIAADKEGKAVDTSWLSKIGDQAYSGKLGKYNVTIRKKRLYRSQQWMTYIGTTEADRVLLLGSETLKEASEKAQRYVSDAAYRKANRDRLVSLLRGG